LKKKAESVKKGKCKLCLLDKELLDSHFVGKAVYRRLSEPSLRNPHPVMMAGDKAKQSSVQLRDYAFCADCEQTFNRRGENFLHANMATTAGFPLLNLFVGQTPLFAEADYKLFEGSKIPGLNCGAILHYGAGIFFKAAAHQWDYEGTPYSIDLGTHTEALRKFVKDGVPLPQDIVIGVSIASTPPKFLGCVVPAQMNISAYAEYKYYVSGIMYTLMVGDKIPIESQKALFSVLPFRPIFMMDDVSDQARDIMRGLTKNTRLSPGLQTLLKSQRP
jgi:hypothetical protein